MIQEPEKRSTCRNCEYLDYRGVDIARETQSKAGYICTIKGHGTSTDKYACPCFLQAGTPLTPEERRHERERVARCSKELITRKPRRKAHKQ